ncbi:MAG TPA: AarF/UbiB family protein [Thermoanaerobaculia bacterium]|nr:AarF/UbiB family protein [Thermoanaerobaculia bacterium]
MLQVRHTGRYRDLAVLLTRYGLRDFRVEVDDLHALREDGERPLEPEVQARAEKFAASLKEMGPTYVKFGQVLSTRPDIVPPEYLTVLESFQDDLEPFSFAEVERMVEEELQVRMSKLFETFESTPLAAASLGQVHRAVLRDGREVVVKVQRPGIEATIREDLKVFREISDSLESHSHLARRMNLRAASDQLARVLLAELDYRQEAFHARLLRQNLEEFPQIYIPAVIDDLTTSRVLTRELIHGRKISKLTNLDRIDHDYGPLAEVLIHSYLKQICVDGFWHSDPHPGNLFIREDQIVLLDFGMVSRMSGDMQDHALRLLLAISERDGDAAADALIRMGYPEEDFDREGFRRGVSDAVAEFHLTEHARANIGSVLFRMIALANRFRIRVPSEMSMLAKTLLHLDSITRTLDPEFDPQSTTRGYMERLLAHKLRQQFHPRNFYTPLLDLNRLLMELPRHSADLMDQVVNGKFTIAVKLPQADDFLKGMHRIANRITAGLIIAALIVGSALMARVETGLRLFGLPAISVISFLVASGFGLYLIIQTVLKDRRDRIRAGTKGK